MSDGDGISFLRPGQGPDTFGHEPAIMRATGLYRKPPGKPDFRWTPDNLRRCQEMRAEGYSAGLIAEAIGTTRNAVLGKLFRLDAPKVGRPDHHRAREPKEPVRPSFVRPHAIQRMRMPPRPTLAKAAELAPLRIPSHPSPIEPKPLGELASLMQRHPAGCAWPIDRDATGHLFCNRHKLAARPYCPEHNAMSWRPRP